MSKYIILLLINISSLNINFTNFFEERYRVYAIERRQFNSDGTETQLSFTLQEATLEVQNRNIIVSIDEKVIVFSVLSTERKSNTKIKYQVKTSDGRIGEIWRIYTPERKSLTFEIYPPGKLYIRYYVQKI
ncbi:MAG: hypothetical protein EOO43_10000 [Flavobacterium sp.]|nr:MAG: hypothetical protein EOO43_10000 [Flavobacterium sp.]